MSIARGRGEDRMHLAELVSAEETEAPEPVFDFERDLGMETWRKMRKTFFDKDIVIADEQHTSICLGVGANINRLCPSTEEFDVRDKWDLFKGYYEMEYEKVKVADPDSSVGEINSWPGLIGAARNIKELFPDKIDELNLERDWDAIKEYFDDLMQDVNNQGDHFEVLSMAHDIVTLFPGKRGEIVLDDKFYKEVEQYLGEDNLGYKIIVSIKYFFPQKAGRIDVSKNQAGELKDLDYHKGKMASDESIVHVFSATIAAETLKALEAQEVKLTDEGLVLVMPPAETYEQAVPERPVRPEL